jgi:outer membrane protein OmpA-like peptidoglycan-associated protein
LRLNTILKISFGLLMLSVALSRPLQASSSDLLIVMEPDGKHYLAQRTLTTESELLSLDLPTGRRAMHEHFSGPEKLTFSTVHQRKPDNLSLWSGAVMTRYRHRYDKGLELQDDGTLKIDMSQAHHQVTSEDTGTLDSSVTWVLPEGATLIAFTDENPNADIIGSWISDENTVSYTQTGGSLSALTLHIALFAEEPEMILDPCVAVVGPTDECSPDIDQDKIPDYRDVCLPSADTITPSDRPDADELGCDGQLQVLLMNVNFQVGNSYLDAASRETLDRVAIAIQRVPEQLFEVSAHTDNEGSSAHNLRLSQNRAAAVRHYLMLRGVGPNQVSGDGYGEQLPLRSNKTSAGRRDNRRVELKRIN